MVHFPESFWAAKAWCKAARGELLSLENLDEVKDQVKEAMQGNAGDYRIDGWADGQWFHKENESLTHEGYELLSALDEKTLTVNLQDWQVTGDTEVRTRLGFICEGKPEELAGNCDEQEDEGPLSLESMEYVGCFEVSPSVANNDQFFPQDSEGKHSDPVACLSQCLLHDIGGFAGLRRDKLCWCATAEPPADNEGESYCTYDCVVNGGLGKCGGSAAVSFYRKK